MFGRSSFLDLELSTMIHADSVSFLISTFSSNSEVSVNVWLSLDKSIGEFTTVYKKYVL